MSIQNKYMICPNCEHNLSWDTSEMGGDIDESISETDDDFVIDYAHCPFCGCNIEIMYPSDSQKKDYKFWNKTNEKNH